MTSPVPVPVPVIETERLVLRGHILDDFPAFAAMWADPDVTRFIGGVPNAEEEAWARFLRGFGSWAALGFGFWCIEEKQSGRRIGETGFLEAMRDLVPSLKGMPEIGWALLPSAQGKGYAREAVGAVLAWGEAFFGPVRTACIIAPENAPSIAVARHFDYREIARTTYKGSPTVVFFRDPAVLKTGSG